MFDPRHITPWRAFLAESALLIFIITLSIMGLDISLRQSALLLLVGTVLVIIINYFTTYYPRISLENQKKSSFLNDYFKFVISDFESEFSPDHDIRVNVMLPRKVVTVQGGRNDPPRFSYDSVLSIIACAGGGEDKDIHPHDSESSDETQVEWSIKPPVEGNCGRAYVHREVRAAGIQEPDEDWTNQELTDHQAQATREVMSVLSAPIRPPEGDEPIAVFNMDAAVPLEETNFTEEEVKRYVAEQYAEPIGTLL